MRIKYLLFITVTLIIIPLTLIANPQGEDLENTDKINKIVKNLYKCSDLAQIKRKKCYQANLDTNLSLTDNLSLVKKIESDTQTNRKIKNLCHDITHVIGAAAYTRHEDKALISGYKNCGDGYYHGIMSNIIIKKDYPTDKLTIFCLKISNNLRDLGLCYHGIGHTLLNIIPTKNDKEFVSILTSSCSNLKEEKQIKKLKESLNSKKIYMSDEKIKEIIDQSCFLGGFGEYLYEKIKDTSYLPGELSMENCESIDQLLIKDCYTLIFFSLISEQILYTDLPLAEIYSNFAKKCDYLPSENDIQIKIKEACFKSISRNYIDNTLMENLKIKNDNAIHFTDLKTQDLYTIVNKVCEIDYNKSCTLWFLLELSEKLITSDFSLLLSKFEGISLRDIKEIS